MTLPYLVMEEVEKLKKIEKEIRDVKDVNLHKRLYYHTIL